MVTFIIVLMIVGLIVGAIARLLLPGRDPIGIFGTIVLGIVGSFVGRFPAEPDPAPHAGHSQFPPGRDHRVDHRRPGAAAPAEAYAPGTRPPPVLTGFPGARRRNTGRGSGSRPSPSGVHWAATRAVASGRNGASSRPRRSKRPATGRAPHGSRGSPSGPLLASSQGRARLTKRFASSTMPQTAAVACRKSNPSSARRPRRPPGGTTRPGPPRRAPPDRRARGDPAVAVTVDHGDHPVDQVAQAVGEFVVGPGDEPLHGEVGVAHPRYLAEQPPAHRVGAVLRGQRGRAPGRRQAGAPAPDLLIFRPPAVR